MQNNRHILSDTWQSAFTLVEVLITLVVIAIAAALSAPAIMAMAPNFTLKSAAQDLFADIQDAKIQSIKEYRDFAVVVGTEGYTVGEPFTDTDGDGRHDAGEAYDDEDGDGNYTGKEVVFTDAYGYGITVGTGNATADWNGDGCATAGNPCNTPGAAVTFNSRGIPDTNDAAFLENEDAAVAYAITISVAGSVKTRKYDGTNPFDQNNWTD